MEKNKSGCGSYFVIVPDFMKSCKLFLLGLFIFVVCSVSCRKKSNSSSSANYKLATIDLTHTTSIEHYTIVYDAYNNVDSMIIVGGGTDTGSTNVRVFSYFGSSYSISDNNGNTLTVDASTTGIVLGIFMLNDTLTMTYSGTQLSATDTKVPGAVYPYYTKADTNYLWNNNGDIVSISFQGGADSCDYDLSKTGQIGDAFRIDDFLNYGKPYIKTNHVPTDLKKNGVWLEKYYYQYDGQGKITQFIKVKNNYGIDPDDSTVYVYGYYAF